MINSRSGYTNANDKANIEINRSKSIPFVYAKYKRSDYNISSLLNHVFFLEIIQV